MSLCLKLLTAQIFYIRLVRLDIFVIIVYRPSSNSSEDNNNLFQFILHFSVDREVILISDFNLLSTNSGNAHPSQGDFEHTTHK